MERSGSMRNARRKALEAARACSVAECPLSSAMEQFPVSAHGDLGSPYVLVGEAPGRLSIQRGKPFSGPAGVLLRDLLKVAARRYHLGQLDLEDVFYLTDLVKCHPGTPDGANRPPDRQEWTRCAAYLARELKPGAAMVLIAGYRNAERIQRTLGLESVDIHSQGWQGYDVPAYRFQHPSPINPYTKTVEYKVHVADLFSKVLVHRMEHGGEDG